MSAPAAARRTPGEGGVWVFVLGDMCVFAAVFGVLLWQRGQDPAMYAAGQAELHVGLGALNTVVLLTSSLLVALGVRAARAGDHRTAPRLLAGAAGCAVAFAALKAVEYTDLATSGHGPGTTTFFASYFTFTGLHLLHVAFGLAVLLGVVRIARRPGLDDHDVTMLESGTSYWHMVDLLWLVLFALLYLVR